MVCGRSNGKSRKPRSGLIRLILIQNCDRRLMQYITISKFPSESLQTRIYTSSELLCRFTSRAIFSNRSRRQDTAAYLATVCMPCGAEVRPDRTHFSTFYRENVVTTFQTILLYGLCDMKRIF